MTVELDFYCSTHKTWVETGCVLAHLRCSNDGDAAVCEIELGVRYPPLADPEE